jgi:GNAT superfamily N-acetyltransferase
MDTAYYLSIEEAPDPHDIQFVRAQLSAFNRDRIAGDCFEPLLVLVRDAEGRIVAGLTGVTYWGWLDTQVLWVEESLRGQGVGRALLAAAEEEAVRRDCRYAHLDTMSFQALPFYEKQGYVVFGELHDIPAGSGQIRYFMHKQLVPNRDEG